MEIKNVPTGVIPDLHAPGHLDHALEFVQDTFSDHKVEQIVSIGDIVDHHYISFHTSEVDAPNSRQEFRKAKKELRRWYKAFPEVYICKGNHDELPARQAKALGMDPEIFLKSLNQIYGMPKTWRWAEHFTMSDELWIEHGLGSGGMYGCKNTALKKGCSYVQGHTHAHAAVFHIPLAFKKMQAMNVGCLMDTEKYNARYGKQFYKVPMSHGCGIIHAPDELQFVPMK